MPAKSVLEIEIDDSAFKKFSQMFERYQTALASTPQQWRSAAAAQQQSARGFRDILMEQSKAIGQQGLLGDAHRDVIGLLKQQESIWDRIKKTNTGAAAIIKGMTDNILKWTPVLSALAGVGGLAGLSALAEGVAGGRRSALGLGSTYGGQKAFSTAFDRFVDPESVLAGVAAARGDVTKRVAFGGLGMLNDRDLQGDDASVSARVVERAKRVADNTKDEFLGTTFQTYGFATLGLSEEDFRRLKRTPAAELQQQEGRFRTLSREYGVGDADQRAYQELVTSIKDAGNQIDTIFVKGLAPLVRDGSISELSKSVIDLTKAFSESGALKESIHEVTDAMQGLANFLKNPLKSIHDQAEKDKAAAKAAGQVDPVSSFTSWVLGGTAPKDLNVTSRTTLSDIWNRGFGIGRGSIADTAFATVPSNSDLRLKYGAGTVDPGLGAFATQLQKNVPGISQFTSFNNDYHKGFKSAHNEGRAFDFTISNPAKSEEVAALVRSEMAKAGISGKVIDEYKNPSSRATAGHIHVQTDVRVMNAAGSNIIVSAQQLTPSP